MRLLVRRYGMETLKEVAAEPNLAWVMPEQMRPKDVRINVTLLKVYTYFWFDNIEVHNTSV